ncbi:DUF6193 family natural product biosynthesis protein [Kitasatospora sp. NPDC098663]|uniref:DUF6193 family natural product biosynthesis protein n=1 Tax=Kitasatospora sp. NPDC098663 TaxID=3364096 RepID=UPI0038028E4D
MVQAAASVPRLHSMYPWTSHSSLNFSLSQSFRDRGAEGFPGIHAGLRSGIPLAGQPCAAGDRRLH